MNIFILDQDIERCAQYHNDKHVVKMILESAQLLCTAHHELGGTAPYKSTHKNHPCAKWVRESAQNYEWLFNLMMALNEEFKYRFDKDQDHLSVIKLRNMAPPLELQYTGLTPFAQAMPEDCRDEDPVLAYRKYYMNHKQHLASWKKRGTPWWYS
jgi:hypothetical protein